MTAKSMISGRTSFPSLGETLLSQERSTLASSRSIATGRFRRQSTTTWRPGEGRDPQTKLGRNLRTCHLWADRTLGLCQGEAPEQGKQAQRGTYLKTRAPPESFTEWHLKTLASKNSRKSHWSGPTIEGSIHPPEQLQTQASERTSKLT